MEFISKATGKPIAEEVLKRAVDKKRRLGGTRKQMLGASERVTE